MSANRLPSTVACHRIRRHRSVSSEVDPLFNDRRGVQADWFRGGPSLHIGNLGKVSTPARSWRFPLRCCFVSPAVPSRLRITSQQAKGWVPPGHEPILPRSARLARNRHSSGGAIPHRAKVARRAPLPPTRAPRRAGMWPQAMWRGQLRCQGQPLGDNGKSPRRGHLAIDGVGTGLERHPAEPLRRQGKRTRAPPNPVGSRTITIIKTTPRTPMPPWP
jgi:hypothetical protein